MCFLLSFQPTWEYAGEKWFVLSEVQEEEMQDKKEKPEGNKQSELQEDRSEEIRKKKRLQSRDYNKRMKERKKNRIYGVRRSLRLQELETNSPCPSMLQPGSPSSTSSSSQDITSQLIIDSLIGLEFDWTQEQIEEFLSDYYPPNIMNI